MNGLDLKMPGQPGVSRGLARLAERRHMLINAKMGAFPPPYCHRVVSKSALGDAPDRGL